MLSVIDELLTYIINLVRSYHWILLNIEPNYGRVEIFDSLKKNLMNTKASFIWSRGNFNHYGIISVSFIHL
jgi:hypothetical protein